MTPDRRNAAAPPRLLVVSNMYPSDGNPVFGSFVQRQVDALRRAGAEVRLVANTDARTGGWASFAKYAALSTRTLFAAFRRDFDVVVGHFLYPTADFARMASTLSGRPLVLVAHGTDVTSVQRDDLLAKASRDALPHAALVVAVSHALEQRLRTELRLPDSVPTAVVNMGVDLATFRPVDDARERIGWAAGERTALWVGNMVPVKGVPTLLDAFTRVRGAGAADRLVLVGDGPLRSELEARVRELGIADAVSFTGRLSQADVALAMAAADVFVLPSLNEGLSVALLEAMACGTPCVASAVGGVPEVLDDPACGRLVPPDDAAALASGIEEVLAAGKAAYRDAALSRARANGTDAMAARFLDAVASVTNRGAR
jgi:glycosyltransferase involved in cell wall biosynthesis